MSLVVKGTKKGHIEFEGLATFPYFSNFFGLAPCFPDSLFVLKIT